MSNDVATDSSVSSEELLFEKQGNICTITLHRPSKLNAISQKIYAELPLLLHRASQDKDISVVVITGAGKYFTSGNDFFQTANGRSKFASMNDYFYSTLQAFRHFTASLIDFPKCLVAAVNGPGVGIGFTMLSLFDYVFMSESAFLMCPFGRLGLVPEGCSTLNFPKIFGPMLSKEILLENRRVTSGEALHFGLANELFLEAQFASRLQARVSELAKLPPQFLGECKQLLRAADRDSLHAANNRECELTKRRLGSSEQMATIANFFNRAKGASKL